MLAKFLLLFLVLGACYPGYAQIDRKPKEKWTIREATDQENNLVFITVNMGYKNYAYKAEFPWCLAINIPVIEQNRNGHPTDAEAVVLNATQDIITEALDKAGATQYVGRVTVQGYREVYYFVADPEKANKALTMLTKKRQPRAWEYQMSEDKQWKRVAPFFK